MDWNLDFNDFDFFNTSNGTGFSDPNMTSNIDFLKVLKSFKNSMLTLNSTGTIVLISLYAPVFILALVGNISVLLVIIPNRRMWSITNNFLLNLAIADLLVTFVCMPMTLAERIYMLWIYGETLCKLTPYLQAVAVSASTMTITTMSIDRCLAICHPMKFRNFRTTKYVRIVIVVIWCISFIISIPILVVRVTVSDEIIVGETLTHCMEAWNSLLYRQIYDTSLLILICVIPGVTILVCYLLMGRRLWVPDRKLSDDSRRSSFKHRTNSERERSMRNITTNRRRLAKLCITIAVVFISCWTPFFVVTTYMDFNMSPDIKNAEHINLLSFTLLVGHLHCVTNPILYCFLHKSFRHYILRCLTSGVKKEPNKVMFGQGYMTFCRSATPFRSLRSASVRSRRRSSSSSGNLTPIQEEALPVGQTGQTKRHSMVVVTERKSSIYKRNGSLQDQCLHEERMTSLRIKNGNDIVSRRHSLVSDTIQMNNLLE